MDLLHFTVSLNFFLTSCSQSPLYPFLLQTPLILLNGRLTAGTAFGDELGQVFALGLHTHAVVVATVVHPLGHVATAGRIVCLGGRSVKTQPTQSGSRRQGSPLVCVCVEVLGREGVGAYLGEVTAEARGPATLRAGGPTAQALAAQDAIAALRVGAPCQVGAALHIASQEGLLVLRAKASCYECWESRRLLASGGQPVLWGLRQDGVPWR